MSPALPIGLAFSEVGLCASLRQAAERYWNGLRGAESPLPKLREEAGTQRAPAKKETDELALQARFYSGELGTSWVSECGHEVRLLDPGEWNRESGPDFLRASLLLNNEERLRGDIELDWHAGGWEQHGHSTNPDFENVILHVFFRRGMREHFARTLSHRQVLQVCLPDLAAPDPSPAGEPFALDSAPLSDPEAARQLITLAAQYRLANKAARLARMEALHGRKAALWQAIAFALGYRKNSIPLLLLAQRVSWRRAQEPDGEALLFGLAGFLEARTFDLAPEATRPYLRSLWEAWWQQRHHQERLVLPSSAWKLGGQRPQNHPHRRAGALSAVAGALDRLLRAIEQDRGEVFSKTLLSLRSDFWQRHWNLQGAPLESPQALIGAVRAEDIFLNVFVPLRAARGAEAFPLWSAREAGQVPRAVRETALWLCPNLPAADLRQAATQQGLLQLAADFRGWQSPRDLARRYRLLPAS